MISVAMAAYNGEKYIAEQLDSILPQLGGEDELIVSCDPSGDHTPEIIQNYAQKDKRIHMLKGPGLGVTENFNNAISASRGDYIFLSDQDDVWKEGKVERILRCFEEERADLVIHNGVHTDENLKPIGGSFFEIYRIGDGKLKNILKPRYSGCCMAFTKRMKDIILPMPEIRGYDQWIATVCEFWGHIAYPEEVLLLHRLHEDNVTPTSSRPLPVVLRLRALLVWNLLKRALREKRKKKGSVTC